MSSFDLNFTTDLLRVGTEGSRDLRFIAAPIGQVNPMCVIQGTSTVAQRFIAGNRSSRSSKSRRDGRQLPGSSSVPPGLDDSHVPRPSTEVLGYSRKSFRD